ncbi:MAG TPA: ROK family protein, partial [Candidatus Obscuribacterales bacterium]
SNLASLTPEEVTTEAVFDAAAEGDIIARRIVNTWHEHVCSGLATLAHTLDPDCFLISGGMSKFVDYDLIHELLVDRTLPRVGEKLSVRPASLGITAGLIGAGQLVLDELLAGVS